MERLLALARDAAGSGEIPVAAAILGPDGAVVSAHANAVERTGDVSAHAEMLAMRDAAIRLGRPRLGGCTLVATLEPCPMCAAACVHFRIGRLVFGAYDPKGGGVEHGPRLFERPDCLHRPITIAGVRERDAAILLRDFFRDLRRTKPPYENDRAFMTWQTD